ncbi:hypothetical protein Calab_1691 [Caldithrix abyssi DSM 13497]|uniref:Uncharacterized protein n=1 Tax=Caldithrix abyssi DSM 13497 TaxID=880073 RepID=H1XRU9_CALAY|nr:hypothetical protein [Caldithrix abyssi]EHO41309.1 hypothetical protein Calab_1691 [Caldithrix abyssi DSM 13497]
MSNVKKFLIIVFTVMLVISLQFNTPLTHKMNNGFSVTQLMNNLFVPEAYATQAGWCKDMGCRSGDYFCAFIVFPDGMGTCYDREGPQWPKE